jgi:4-amino-4-deoxychorismate lyase
MQTQLPIISVNGILGKEVSPLDRGFTYGDGVFETCRLMSGRIPLWNRHSKRLLEGCKKLLIPVSGELVQNYLSQLVALLAPQDQADAVIKIIVTRGQGGRGYRLPDEVVPTICIGIFPSAQYPKSHSTYGVNLRVCDQRLGTNSHLAGIKHLNRLEYVLARAEWADLDIADGLLLDTNENLIEATSSNIFAVKDGSLFTPDLSGAGVAGVMRGFIMEVLSAELGLGVSVKKMSICDLYLADEVFLCNSILGIWPVVKVCGAPDHVFAVGPTTIALGKLLEAKLSAMIREPLLL